MSRHRKAVREELHLLDIGGREIGLTVRRHPKARRIILKLDNSGDGAVVTIPLRTPAAEGIDMARRQAAWIAERLSAQPKRIDFADGQRLPYRGDAHIIRHRPDLPGVVRIEDGEIRVSGKSEHLARRLHDWLKAQAGREIRALAETKAAGLGHRHRRVTIRDTRSRWGSCSAAGCLSFSWRLILAPPPILDYVVAHEVAHLAHMNHGAAFWHAVRGLTDSDVERSRAWLGRHGEGLHRIG